jgi:hypothetical protein
MKRTSLRLLLPVALLAALALAGCQMGGAGAGPATSGDTDLSWDQQALQSIGFSLDDVAPGFAAVDPSQLVPSASPSPGRGIRPGRLRHRLLRFGFGRRIEHGEAVVQTDEGTRTVVVQRGQVTAVDATSATVRSADGFTLTWVFGNPFTVVKDRAKATPAAVAVGATVGVAGFKDGGTTTARLLVVTAG